MSISSSPLWLKDSSVLLFSFKVQWAVLATLQVKSQSGSCNEIWILRPFSKAAGKTWARFALDTEHQYWTVAVQYLCRVKKISMTSNVLPYTLPLARPAQTKIQMLTTSSRIVTILVKIPFTPLRTLTANHFKKCKIYVHNCRAQ